MAPSVGRALVTTDASTDLLGASQRRYRAGATESNHRGPTEVTGSFLPPGLLPLWRQQWHPTAFPTSTDDPQPRTHTVAFK
jgi:hypothetical protein